MESVAIYYISARGGLNKRKNWTRCESGRNKINRIWEQTWANNGDDISKTWGETVWDGHFLCFHVKKLVWEDNEKVVDLVKAIFMQVFFMEKLDSREMPSEA